MDDTSDNKFFTFDFNFKGNIQKDMKGIIT